MILIISSTAVRDASQDEQTKKRHHPVRQIAGFVAAT
jgi:hypothetical protein